MFAPECSNEDAFFLINSFEHSGKVPAYYGDTFICHAVCQELAGQTISLKEIIATRNRRRRQLREQLSDRRAVVELLLEAHAVEEPPPPASPEEPPTPRLKRYINE